MTQVQCGPAVTEVVSGEVEVVEGVAAEWKALCEEGPSNQPFYRPEWYSAYLRAFEPGCKVHLFLSRVEGRLRALLPLIEERTTFFRVPVRKLRSPTGHHYPRFDLVRGVKPDSQPAIDAIWALLHGSREWDLLEVRETPEDGAFEDVLNCARRDGFPTGKWPSGRSPYVPLREGATWEAFEAALSKQMLDTLRRQRRRLEKEGKLVVLRYTHPIPGRMEQFYAMEQSGWKGDVGGAIANRENVRQFYSKIAEQAENYGGLRLFFLEHNRRAIAAVLDMELAGRHYALKTAYDEEYSKYGPGTLLFLEVLRDCVESGIREVDLLGDLTEWKARWTKEIRPHSWSYVFRRSFLGWLLHSLKFRVVPALKPLLQRKEGKSRPEA